MRIQGKQVIPDERKYSKADSVVIYEHYEQWGDGINVGFGDGHVEFMKDEAEFLKRLNPPASE
jgi:prepilin-type processing-associated H-X9-DG protein